MTALVGTAGIVLALTSALLLVAEGVRSARRGAATPRLRPAVLAIAVGAVLAMAALEWALLTDDFSIEYVARNSARATPMLFKGATAWAALEGSIVLWGLVLAGYLVAVWRQVRNVEDDRLGFAALAAIGAVAVFFFGLMATAANPFQVLATVPADGPGPNPLLQNHVLMAVHPPLLYLGFVGWTVPFAFGIGALALGDAGREWLRRTRRWSLTAWGFLTAGIVVGALWSYAVLGWGGYWAWDPVENASLLPWLAGTAFLHSAIAQARRGVLRSWNVTLVIATFALTILGTFLTRSGVVASVHSFTQSAVGPALLAFLVVVVVGGLGLFAARAHLVASAPRLESLASREGAFLANNLLLIVFTFTVLAGTTYPIIVEAWSGAQVSVGRPFFDRITVPLSLTLLLAMGLGPLLPYRIARGTVVRERVRIPVVVGLAAGAGLVVAGVRAPSLVGVAMLAAAIVAAGLRQLLVAARAIPGARLRAAVHVARRDRGYWGGQLSHAGVALAALAIAASGSLADRAGLTLVEGETATFADYEVTYTGAFSRDEAHRTVTGARLAIARGDDPVAVLEPAISTFRNATQPVGTPAIRTTLAQDLYASITRLDDGRVSVDLYRYPLMWLLWLGGAVTASGAVWALGRPRRRAAVTHSDPREDHEQEVLIDA